MNPPECTNWRPGHAYVPGRNERHPEDLFDRFKIGLSDVHHLALNETLAWQMGCAFLREGFFWEAHEIFEAVWMACPPNTPEKLLVQAIIQRANAYLKREMGQDRATARLIQASEQLAREAFARQHDAILGITQLMWEADDFG